MSLTVGEFCAGYNGLGKAVEEVFDATPAWFFEFDAAPSKILAHHYPDVPNHGDMTTADWSQIEPVDIISGGTPCQDEAIQHDGGEAQGINRTGVPDESDRDALWTGPIGEDASNTISEYRGQRREPGPSKAQGGRTSAVYPRRCGTHLTPDAQGDGRDEGRAEPARLIRGSDAPLSGDAPVADSIGGGRGRRSRMPGGTGWRT